MELIKLKKENLLAEKIFVWLFFPLLFFVPDFHIDKIPFTIDINNILLIFTIFFIIKNKWFQEKNLRYFLICGGLCLYIFFTIAINQQLGTINNYFEIYHLFKFFCFYIFFKEVLKKQSLELIFDICFIGLVIFHLFHYFNLFDFNKIIMPLYCGEDSPHLLFFGYNSLGEPASKRALGILGNPNTNAILYIFFIILYAPTQQWKRKNIIFFFVSLSLFLSCQSRTGLIALIIILLINLYFIKISLKKKFLLLSIISCIIVSNLYFPTILQLLHIQIPTQTHSMDYAASLLDTSALQSNSWTNRLQIWKDLLNMIAEKPIFGHSPNKTFFYENHIHTENEYILISWRYGIIGLILYLSLYLKIILNTFKQVNSSIYAKNLLLITIVFAITACTNCPFSQDKLAILFIVFAAHKNIFPCFNNKKVLIE